MNENPYSPLPSVLERSRAAAGRFNQYPDGLCTELTAAIAEHFGVSVDQVAVGAGGTAMIQQLLLAAAGQGDEVIFPWPSFERYPILSRIVGADPVQVELDGPDQNLSAMADAVTARTRMILICNPNDPTGTVLHRDRLHDFLQRVPSDVLVVLDEAYRDFVRDPEVPDGIELCARWPNLAVLRTFSHAYGLAGLRVGFTIAHSSVTAAVRKTALPLGVTALAQEAAIASLSLRDELFERVEALVKERDRLWRALRTQGWGVPVGEGNFLWLPLGERSAAFTQACATQGIVVREFPGEGVRVTVREREANDLVAFVASGFSAS